MSRHSTVRPGRIDKRRQASRPPAESGVDAAPALQLQSELDRFVDRAVPLTVAESRYLRHLFASAGPGASPLVTRFDAILDSPLDVDESVLRRLRLELESLGPKAAARAGTNPIGSMLDQVKSTSRTLEVHARRLSPGSSTRRREPGRRTERVDAVAQEDGSDQRPFAPGTVRGLHVRQGGHDFMLPIEFVERAVAVGPGPLPTVLGRPVAHVLGEICDVVELVNYFGLQGGHSSPSLLIVMSASNRRVAIAVDEVVGAVEASLRPMEGVLPGNRVPVDVAHLETGHLALIPDIAPLVR